MCTCVTAVRGRQMISDWKSLSILKRFLIAGASGRKSDASRRYYLTGSENERLDSIRNFYGDLLTRVVCKLLVVNV